MRASCFVGLRLQSDVAASVLVSKPTDEAFEEKLRKRGDADAEDH